MQKKYCLLALALVFMLGTTVASLPPVKAPTEEVRFFISPTIIPAVPVGALVVVEVWIESPVAWDNTALGIVGYALSVRGDPRALEPVGVGKIPAGMGFLEDFLIRWWYEFYWTQMLPPVDLDPVTCTILDVSEYIVSYNTLGVGAGGGPAPLMRFLFKSRSNVIPSVTGIFGCYVTEISATYTTADGVDHYVDIMDDGYYIAETPDTVMFDSGEGLDPADPLHSDWHELWPTYCDDWTLESWVDNGDGVLSVSDQIGMNNTDSPGEHSCFHVDWVNPTPTVDDGKTDLVLTITEASDLSIEGVVLPYFGYVPLIYPTPEPSIYYEINVTVTNQGTAEAGRFNVSFTVHLEGEMIPEYGRKETVESLQQGASENLLFDWSPQDYGNYTLTIAADSDNDIMELDETNNVRSTWVIGTIRGDMDGDGYVGSADFSIFAGLYGIGYPFPPYPPADINWDGYVGSADFSMLAANYGQTI